MLSRYHIHGHIWINFYGLFVALGICSAILLFYHTAKFRQVNHNNLINFALIMIISGLLGTRLYYVVFHWTEFRDRSLLDMAAFWRGGLMFQGGPLLAILVSFFTLGRLGLKFWPTGDVIAPSLALGQGIGRVGCFFAGCCYGRATTIDNPLAVVFPLSALAPPGIPLWPTQLMESAGLLALFAFLLLSLGKPRFARRPGLVASFYLLGSGLLRFVVDRFRGDDRGELVLSLVPTTLTSLLIVLLGLIVLIIVLRRGVGPTGDRIGAVS